MTDTATPIPEDSNRALVAEAAERAVAVYGRAWRHLMEGAALRGRVHATMPRLTMRQVMVHGLVPYRTEEHDEWAP